MEMEQTISYPKGLKWTKQRKHVYEVLAEATEPLTAVQIYHQVEHVIEGNSYALSTIYRILTSFEEKNFIIKSNWMGDGTVVYELNRGEHTHYAVCLGCHSRIPLQQCPFEHIHLEENMNDFQITGHKIEVYGYCPKCKKNLG